MKTVLLLLSVTAIAPCFAASDISTACRDQRAVVCLIDHAQARLDACAAMAGLKRPDAGSVQGAESPEDRTRRHDCVSQARDDTEPLYREALHAVRFQRGIVADVRDYYAKWNETLTALGSSGDTSSSAVKERWREELQRLDKMADQLLRE